MPCRNNLRRRAFAVEMLVATLIIMASASAAVADRLHLIDGKVVEVDQAWEDKQSVWYRRGNVTQSVDRARVRRIERSSASADQTVTSNIGEAVTGTQAKPSATSRAVNVRDTRTTARTTDGRSESAVAKPQPNFQSVWIHLAGGARVEADEANETSDGVWYKRDNLQIFIPRARVERVERGAAESLAAASPSPSFSRARGWTTGNARLDELIKQNGALHGVDPYLIFCVMEQESHFNARAVSPKGARGLMQLMPRTAARFGVRRAHDPAENIRGGTRYLKELLTMFGGRVELVLAGYNAGEGAVMRYGQRVPPYRETRNYVQRITQRYGRAGTPTNPAAQATGARN